MSLSFFLDQCVPRSVGDALEQSGHQIGMVREYLPINASDPQVIAQAQKLDAILVTLNGDFADIINYPPADYGGILALQLKNTPTVLPAIILRMLTYLAEHPEREHYRGKLFLIEPHRIRVKE